MIFEAVCDISASTRKTFMTTIVAARDGDTARGLSPVACCADLRASTTARATGTAREDSGWLRDVDDRVLWVQLRGDGEGGRLWWRAVGGDVCQVDVLRKLQLSIVGSGTLTRVTLAPFLAHLQCTQ